MTNVLTHEEKELLRNALHTEGVLTNDYSAVVTIRVKLGLRPLAGECDEEND